jgi:hypothetical protein
MSQLTKVSIFAIPFGKKRARDFFAGLFQASRGKNMRVVTLVAVSTLPLMQYKESAQGRTIMICFHLLCCCCCSTTTSPATTTPTPERGESRNVVVALFVVSRTSAAAAIVVVAVAAHGGSINLWFTFGILDCILLTVDATSDR